MDVLDPNFNHKCYILEREDKIKRRADAPPPYKEEDAEILGEVARYVEAKLVTAYGFSHIPIPDDDNESMPHTSILASRGWMSATKILLIVQNASGSVMGIFSRSIVMQEGLSKGSMIPYVDRALSEGYAILILRPNTNSVTEIDPASNQPLKRPIVGSESPEIHALYVLENIIPLAENVNHIAFLAYGNGASLCKEIMLRQMVLSKDDGHGQTNRIKAFITIEASHIIEEDDATDFKDIVASMAVNMECSTAPKGYRLGYRRKKLGCTSVSLGLPPGQTEVQNVAASVALALDPVFLYLRQSETANPLSLATNFCASFARDCGHNPSSAVMNTNPNDIDFNQACITEEEPTEPEKKPGFFSRMFGKKESNNKSPLRGATDSLPTPAPSISSSSMNPPKTTSESSNRNQSQDMMRDVPSVRVAPSNQQTTNRILSTVPTPAVEEALPAMEHRQDEKLTVNDFDLMKVVGKGAFGKVMLVRKKVGANAGNIYAMKVLKKSVVAAKGQIEHTKSERAILCEIRHPYIVRLRFAFQSEDKLYLVTDYYNGGSLFYHLRKSKCFTEERARFYAAELLLALDHLHQQNIIYRDLKLENILMDHLGHIALTDFGLSKQDIDKSGGATTFCGTAEYIAPELLQGVKYGKSVDWWSFGILLFEMIQGRTPFYDKNRKLMFYRIIHTRPSYPPNFSPEVQDCLSGLLRVSDQERLGNGENGGQAIMETPFFSVIDFEALTRRAVPPPFTPEVVDELDTKYVPKAYLKDEAKDSFSEPVKGGNANFDQFTFKGETSLDS